MPNTNSQQTGGQVLVEELKRHGAELAFGVPGESFLAALDAFVDHPELSFITCRQEGGASMMAEAYGKLTGEPGICFVTRGPGATSASAGVHVAFQDSTPMILFIGQVARGMLEREAFQEIDYRRMYGQLAKWVAQIDDPERIPEFVSRAFYTATSGRPGPVVLALPEDVLSGPCTAPTAAAYRRVDGIYPGPTQMTFFAELLASAKRPLVILGGGGWTAVTGAAVAAFAEAQNLPIACGFRRQDYFDNNHPNYVGDVGIGINPKLAERVAESDLLIALGPRLGEMTTGGYSLLDIPTPRQPLVHIHRDPEELGRVYQPVLAINASQHSFAEAAAQLPAVKKRPWDDWTAAARQDYLAHIQPPTTPGELQMGEVMLWLRDALPDDAIITNGAGNLWSARRGRRQGGPSRSNGGLLRRRRLLSDARPGTGDRHELWPEHRGDRGQQQHVRHDPHAPGAELSRPGQRHRPDQSRLRRLCQGLRRSWRDGAAQRGVPGRFRAGAGGG
jgi:acetolactate synthase-1/2/3 large subunit